MKYIKLFFILFLFFPCFSYSYEYYSVDYSRYGDFNTKSCIKTTDRFSNDGVANVLSCASKLGDSYLANTYRQKIGSVPADSTEASYFIFIFTATDSDYPTDYDIIYTFKAVSGCEDGEHLNEYTGKCQEPCPIGTNETQIFPDVAGMVTSACIGGCRADLYDNNPSMWFQNGTDDDPRPYGLFMFTGDFCEGNILGGGTAADGAGADDTGTDDGSGSDTGTDAGSGSDSGVCNVGSDDWPACDDVFGAMVDPTTPISNPVVTDDNDPTQTNPSDSEPADDTVPAPVESQTDVTEAIVSLNADLNNSIADVNTAIANLNNKSDKNNELIVTQIQSDYDQYVSLLAADEKNAEAITRAVAGNARVVEASNNNIADAINNICDPRVEVCENVGSHGLDSSDVQTMYSQMWDSAEKSQDDAENTLYDTVDDIIQTPVVHGDDASFFESAIKDALPNISDCSPLEFDVPYLNRTYSIDCTFSVQAKMIISWIIYMWTIIYLFDVVTQDITPKVVPYNRRRFH